MPAKKTTTTSMIYQLKITLKDSKPPMRRRIQVKEDTTLSTLHQILQIAMGWTNAHLHQFIADGMYYGEPDPEYGFAMVNEKRSRLKEIVRNVKDKCLYEYDFGTDGTMRFFWRRSWSRRPRRDTHTASRGSGIVRQKIEAVSGAIGPFWKRLATRITLSMTSIWSGLKTPSIRKRLPWRR